MLITDVKMPGMDGMELLVKAKRAAPWLPVLVITGYGDIPTAVRALKAGAADFIEKPLKRKNFITAVESVLRQNTLYRLPQGKSLTRTEMKILRLILDDRSNLEIAYILSRSIRTIEDHRRHIMLKFNAHNIADLARKSVTMGLL